MPTIGRLEGTDYKWYEFADLEELEALPFVKAEIESVPQPYAQEEFDNFQALCDAVDPIVDDTVGGRVVPPWETRTRGKFVRLFVQPLEGPRATNELRVNIYHLLFVERRFEDGLGAYPIGLISGIIEGLDAAPLARRPTVRTRTPDPRNGA